MLVYPWARQYFFYFLPNLDRLFKNCIKWGEGVVNWLPPEKTTLKKPSLIRVKKASNVYLQYTLQNILQKFLWNILYPKYFSKYSKPLYFKQRLMIPNREGWHYLAVKRLSALIWGKTSKRIGNFYCLNCLYSFRTINKLESLFLWCCYAFWRH